MAILDNAFPESPDFHDFTEEKLQDDIRGFIWRFMIMSLL